MLPWLFTRKGASGFSWASTADQVTAGLSAAGLTAIVTGVSSGIGAEMARALALRGGSHDDGQVHSRRSTTSTSINKLASLTSRTPGRYGEGKAANKSSNYNV